MCRDQLGAGFDYTRHTNTTKIVGGWRDGTIATWSLNYDAYALSTDGIHSLLERDQSGQCVSYSLATWPKEKRPTPMAFGLGNVPLNASDSVAWWYGLELFEAEMGMDLWRTANSNELNYNPNPNGTPSWDGILVQPMQDNSVARIKGYSADGRDILSALIQLDTRYMQNPWSAHEAGHTEGIGHSPIKNPGLMNPGELPDPFRTLGATNVAIIQAFIDDGDLRRATGAKSGFPGEDMGERRMLNDPNFPVRTVCSWQQ